MFYFSTLGSGQDFLLLLQVSGDDHGHADRVFLEAILERRPTQFITNNEIYGNATQTGKKPTGRPAGSS